MQPPRKIILSAIAVLFLSQFFQYGETGHTILTMDLGRNLTAGGLPYGGETGWGLHAWWFYLTLMTLFAYLFYTSVRAIAIYRACLALFIFCGLGSGSGAILGGVSLLVCGYAVFKKVKENRENQPPEIPKSIP